MNNNEFPISINNIAPHPHAAILTENVREKPQFLKQRIQVPTGRKVLKGVRVKNKKTGEKQLVDETSPQGVLFARRDPENDKVVIGWSVVNIAAGDYFDNEKGTRIAAGRSVTSTNTEIPRIVRKAVEGRFANRVQKYFRVPADKVVIAGEQ